jgi:hypothetical protein
VPFGWRGIIVERHCLEPLELPQRYGNHEGTG